MPRLQAFYGGRPHDWMRMPAGWLRRFATMMSRIDAERQVGRLRDALIGSGSVEASEVQRIMREYERTADPEAARPKKPTSLESLQAMGIGVEYEDSGGGE